MADSYDRYENEHSGGGFMMGLLTGTVLGAGLGMLLAPKAGSELRGALGEQARNIGHKASEQYRRASDSAGNWAEKGASSWIARVARRRTEPTIRVDTRAARRHPARSAGRPTAVRISGGPERWAPAAAKASGAFSRARS
jgi:hypothetical protein